MTLYDHEAIRRAYPDTAIIIDGTDSNAGVYKTDGTKFTPVQSNIDTARTAIDNEKASVAYKDDRRVGFGETSRFIQTKHIRKYTKTSRQQTRYK